MFFELQLSAPPTLLKFLACAVFEEQKRWKTLGFVLEAIGAESIEAE